MNKIKNIKKAYALGLLPKIAFERAIVNFESYLDDGTSIVNDPSSTSCEDEITISDSETNVQVFKSKYRREQFAILKNIFHPDRYSFSNKKITKPPFVQKNNTKFAISEQVDKRILLQLNSFEKNKKFIAQNITSVGLAKEFGTNSKYLANVINRYKNKNFKNYINDLRVEYVIQVVTSNKLYRQFTIKALGNMAGFKYAESFSRAFIRKTGTSPTCFIQTDTHCTAR